MEPVRLDRKLQDLLAEVTLKLINSTVIFIKPVVHPLIRFIDPTVRFLDATVGLTKPVIHPLIHLIYTHAQALKGIPYFHT